MSYHTPQRYDRFYQLDERNDTRSSFQRDRDRILHSSEFLRLDRVTQVVSPIEDNVFHNRLTHSLKVAQVGRRLAERLVSDPKNLKIAKALGGLDSDVVEAACLAHDLGHPPFGHIAEAKLRELVVDLGDPDGYEGNAQSFRIVCKLSFRRIEPSSGIGLDLTRATLNAILKYPWFHSEDGPKSKKWGAYRSEQREFDFARRLSPQADQPSLEAAVMDWADDIAYSVHDLEDFYRAGIVPLDRLVISEDTREEFLDKVFKRWDRNGKAYDEDRYRNIMHTLFDFIPVARPYRGETRQRGAIRTLSSSLIDRFIRSAHLPAIDLKEESSFTDTLYNKPAGRHIRSGDKNLIIDIEQQMEVALLKELTWQYVIDNPALANQQHGKAQIIEHLFKTYWAAVEKDDLAILPVSAKEQIINLDKIGGSKHARVRVIADAVSSMTDNEALRLYQQLTGIDPGSILEYRPQ